jgi:hypothetical protein
VNVAGGLLGFAAGLRLAAWLKRRVFTRSSPPPSFGTNVTQLDDYRKPDPPKHRRIK